ncbi:MAG: signal peptide peptidase SppA [Sphingomonas sp.]|uniref:signal peptide peptidase SppA n=1 Tax=Sphingomonas sp. TaxID=28214 RepID=UPI0012092B51|nr:signal peptide peptidase SppA [Sphingomonas sp.]THD37924.1 MAG: signal peptide peptidase SppA [Sphingomonas sp.]
MKLVRGAWKILVGIKDGLVLLFMLIFFGVLFAALSGKPNAGRISDGALVLKLDGAIVEQPATPTALAAAQGEGPDHEFRLRDLVRAIDTAKDDARVKVLVLDLDSYGGGYPAAVTEVANAIGRFKTSGKKVLAYATAYTDGSYLLASNASEIWVNPMGGTLFMGPGGNQLYYKGLIDKLGVNVHVYRVGKFKSYVEPYTRADQSPEAKEALTALYGSIFGQWKDLIHKARPKAQIDQFLTTPDQAITAAKGDIAQANLAAGLVDKLGDRVAFGKHVAELAGDAPKKVAGAYAKIDYNDWVAANPIPTGGDKIGIVTVAGEIVDGKAGPGTAGGDTIAKAVLDALARKELKALVVRVDSPGGSALASETIRLAVLEAKKQGLPVVVSMGGLAASGGYWVSTSGDVIFAEPNTITGSIGIFGIIPTFENSLAKLGVTADGVKTTPLSGQPDIYGGTNPQVDAILQSAIEHGYAQFLSRVATARKLTPQRVDEIGQGRVWDGGTARQIGLVDRFGTLDDAVAEAAKRAGLDPKNVSRVYLEKKPSWFTQLLAAWGKDDDDNDLQARDVFGVIASERRDVLARAVGDAKRLAGASSVQARCLECAGFSDARAGRADLNVAQLLIKAIWP